MTFARQVDRVRAGFMAMPDLELTVAQAGRLWCLGFDDCRYVLDALVDAGFLRWTMRRTVVWTGRAMPLDGDFEPAYVSVRSAPVADKSV